MLISMNEQIFRAQQSALSTHFSLHCGSKEADMTKWSSDKNPDNRDYIAHCSPVLMEVVCWVSALYRAFFQPTIVGIARLLDGWFSSSSNVVACAKCVNRPLNSFNVSRSFGNSSTLEEISSPTFLRTPSHVSSAFKRPFSIANVLFHLVTAN